MFILRDMLRVAGECFDGRKVKDLCCTPWCMARKGVRMLYGTAQNEWDCVAVHQRESSLLKFLFITLIWSSSWRDLSPNHTQASSWRVLVGTGRNTAMEQAKKEAVCTVRDPSRALSHSFSCLVKKLVLVVCGVFFLTI